MHASGGVWGVKGKHGIGCIVNEKCGVNYILMQISPQ